MTYIKLEKIGNSGINTDDSVFNLSPTTWTDCNNVGFRENAIYRLLGFQSAAVLGTPSATPFFLFKGKDGVQANEYFIYAGLNKVFAIIGDSNVHNNITRTTSTASNVADVNYSATINNAWQAGVINGIMVLNNGTDIPQKWIQALSTQNLLNLDGWTSVAGTLRATVVRPFKNYLIAGDITKGGVRFPQMIKWSTSASAGNVPLSWDETNATNDAGEFELSETADYFVDMLPLRDINAIYKENTVWGMRFIGFPFVFQFFKIFSEFGAIAKNCVVEFKDRHVVLTNDDVIIHDGQSYESLVDNRVREGIFNSIDPDSKSNCFVFYDVKRAEIYIGIPTTSSYPDVIWIYNTRYRTWSKRSLPSVNSIISDFGVVQASIWDSVTTIWDNYIGAWNAGAVATGELIMISSDSNKIFKLNSGNTADGSALNSFIVKQGISWKDQSFEQDNVELKFLSSVRPEISASTSVQVSISLGVQFKPTDTIDYSPAIPFKPGTDEIVFFNRAGRYFSFRFETLSGAVWELKSMAIDINPIGLYA